MSNVIPDPLLYLFFAVAAAVGLFKVISVKQWKLFDLTPLRSSSVPFLLSVAPVTAVLWLGKLGDFEFASAAPYFAGAATLAFLLSQTGVTAEIRSVILLASAVALTLLSPTDSVQPVLGSLSGLLIWKTVENLLHKPESRFDDVVAPIVWLCTVLWTRVQVDEVTVADSFICQSLVLGTLAVSLFIRWVQPIALSNDRLYIKRLLLSAAGGLALLALITKVLMNEELQLIAALAAGGFLTTYLLQSLDSGADQTFELWRGLKNILLVGILTLVATRLFGMQGLLVLAATTVIAPLPGSALVVGLFWVSRVLIQAYVLQYNANITGINVMHTYTTAALYAGVISVLVLSVFIKEIKDRRVLSALFLGSVCMVPCATGYFLHSEPTGSLLVSVGVTAVVVALLAPAMYRSQSIDQENVILLPVLATTLGLLSKDLLWIGNEASVQDRIVVVLAIAFTGLCVGLIGQILRSVRHRKQISMADPAG